MLVLGQKRAHFFLELDHGFGPLEVLPNGGDEPRLKKLPGC